MRSAIVLFVCLCGSMAYGQYDINFAPYPPAPSNPPLSMIPPPQATEMWQYGWRESWSHEVRPLNHYQGQNAEGWYMNNYGQWQRNLPQGYQPSPCNPYIYQCPQPQYYYPQQNYYNYQRRFFSPGG